MTISIIVAVSSNNVIGAGGKMPWKIPGEQKRFRDLSLGKTVIMGRKTFEEIGKPLPDRYTVVISRTKKFNFSNCTTVSSFSAALEKFKHKEELIIAGGARVYREALPLTDFIYLTRIHRDFSGDVYFPEWDESAFKITYTRRINGPIPYTYYTYKRIE